MTELLSSSTADPMARVKAIHAFVWTWMLRQHIAKRNGPGAILTPTEKTAEIGRERRAGFFGRLDCRVPIFFGVHAGQALPSSRRIWARTFCRAVTKPDRSRLPKSPSDIEQNSPNRLRMPGDGRANSRSDRGVLDAHAGRERDCDGLHIVRLAIYARRPKYV
jgi:hypothetical protein